MLKGISASLHPDALHALASMGHGDELAIVDRNFPATAVAAETVLGRPLQVGVDAIEILQAVLTVFPIDTFDVERAPVRGMQVVDDPDKVPAVVQDAAPIFTAAGAQVALIERFAFYKAAKGAFVILRCTEARPYGNFIIRKGVV